MSNVMISTDNYIKNKTKTVLIDDTEFLVRNMGAGDQLTVLELTRKIQKLKDDFDNTEDEKAKVEIIERMTNITLEIEAVYVGLFDDGLKNNSKSKKIVRKLGIDKMQFLLSDIFKKGS